MKGHIYLPACLVFTLDYNALSCAAFLLRSIDGSVACGVEKNAFFQTTTLPSLRTLLNRITPFAHERAKFKIVTFYKITN